MGKVVIGAALSLDGFCADRNGDLSKLYPDLAELRKTESLRESIRDTGAVVMGRRAYDLAQGDLTGYEYQVPIFVLTHRPPDRAIKGENDKLTLTFLAEGIESAIERAKAAARGRDVTVVGGASTAQQCLNAGLVDEIHIHLRPVLLIEGLRFFEHLERDDVQLETIKVSETPLGTDIKLRVRRP